MALIWADGFDAMTAGVAGSAYQFYGSYGASYVAPGRSGRPFSGPYAMSGTSSGTVYPYRFFKVPYAVVTMGVAVCAKNSGSVYIACFYSAGQQICRLYVGSDGRLYFDGGGGYYGNRLSFDGNQWYYVETKLTCGLGTTASVEVRVNGEVYLNYVGFNLGYTAVDGAGPAVKYADNALYEVKVDDLYITDGEFLGDVRVLTIAPNGNGSSSQLLGSDGNSTDNYLLVDESPPVTTDYVGSGTVGHKDTYQFSGISTSWANVAGVVVNSYVAKSDVGLISGRTLASLGGTTLASPKAALSPTYAMAPVVFPQKPGGGAWTPADVNSAEFGWEVQAEDV